MIKVKISYHDDVVYCENLELEKKEYIITRWKENSLAIFELQHVKKLHLESSENRMKRTLVRLIASYAQTLEYNGKWYFPKEMLNNIKYEDDYINIEIMNVQEKRE